MSSNEAVSPGWYPHPESPQQERWWDGRGWTDHVRPGASGGGAPGTAQGDGAAANRPAYVVLQVVLKEKFLGTGSGNLTELEHVINSQAARGYRLHTITTAASGSKGLGGGDRIQATMIFEHLG